MPVQLIKTVNETTDFPEIVYIFYQQTGEGTWPKYIELLKFCQEITTTLQGINRGKYSK